ncbi:MAG: hypothetical protein MJZ50_05150 [Treponema sp.]|nr:hypothetical protein [Treponema sp.]
MVTEKYCLRQDGLDSYFVMTIEPWNMALRVTRIQQVSCRNGSSSGCILLSCRSGDAIDNGDDSGLTALTSYGTGNLDSPWTIRAKVSAGENSAAGYASGNSHDDGSGGFPTLMVGRKNFLDFEWAGRRFSMEIAVEVKAGYEDYLLASSLENFSVKACTEYPSRIFMPDIDFEDLAPEIRGYLDLCFENQREVFSFGNSIQAIGYTDKEFLSAEEGIALARSALAFAEGHVLYSPLGADSPKMFSKRSAMEEYIAGGLSGRMNCSGCDSPGFLSHCLLSAGLGDRICGADGLLFSVRDLEQFITMEGENLFSTQIEFLLRNKRDVFSSMILESRDVPYVAAVVPSAEKVRPGDLLVWCPDGTGRKDNDTGGFYSCAVVCSVESENGIGSPAKENVMAVLIPDIPGDRARKMSWAQMEDLFKGSRHYVPMRILLRTSRDMKDENRYESDAGEIFAFDSEPGILDFSFSHEEDQGCIAGGGFCFIPNTGESLVLEGIQARLKARTRQALFNGVAHERVPVEVVFQRKNFLYGGQNGGAGNPSGTPGECSIRLEVFDAAGNRREYGIYSAGVDGDASCILEKTSAEDFFLDEGGRFFLGDDLVCGFRIYPVGLDFAPVIGESYSILLEHDGRCIAKTPPERDVAFYDKKSVWRGGLYLVEWNFDRALPDWNMVHRWIGRDGNPWNRSCSSGTLFTAMSSLSVGNGGQCIELGPKSGTGASVAFSKGGRMNPFEYQANLLKTGELVRDVFSPLAFDSYPSFTYGEDLASDLEKASLIWKNHEELFKAVSESSGGRETLYGLANWSGTLAPDNDPENYPAAVRNAGIDSQGFMEIAFGGGAEARELLVDDSFGAVDFQELACTLVPGDIFSYRQEGEDEWQEGILCAIDRNAFFNGDDLGSALKKLEFFQCSDLGVVRRSVADCNVIGKNGNWRFYRKRYY